MRQLPHFDRRKYDLQKLLGTRSYLRQRTIAFKARRAVFGQHECGEPSIIFVASFYLCTSVVSAIS